MHIQKSQPNQEHQSLRTQGKSFTTNQTQEAQTYSKCYGKDNFHPASKTRGKTCWSVLITALPLDTALLYGLHIGHFQSCPTFISTSSTLNSFPSCFPPTGCNRTGGNVPFHKHGSPQTWTFEKIKQISKRGFQLLISWQADLTCPRAHSRPPLSQAVFW